MAMPPEVNQCFKEAGLLDPWLDPIRDWWLHAGNRAQAQRIEKLTAVGRLAESWTCEYETKRTGKTPQWISLDTTFAGYDVLSCNSATDEIPLRIEVKGSERRPKEAEFFVTRNEFETAMRSDHYIFHLWYVAQARQLFIVPFSELTKHIPSDCGDGRWDASKMRYASFEAYRVV
jgi:hypothetical protein